MNERDVKDIMRMVRQQYEPSDNDSDRIYKAIIATPLLPVPSSMSSGIKSLALVKGIGATVFVIALTTGVYRWMSQPHETDAIQSSQPVAPMAVATKNSTDTAPKPDVAATAPAVNTDSVTAVVPAVTETNTEPQSSNVSATPISAAFPVTATRKTKTRQSQPNLSSADRTITPEDTLGMELQLVSGAAKAINGGDTQSAISLLDRHRAEFPRGVMAQERNGLEIIALCKAGSTNAAKKKYDLFKTRSPKAPILMRIVNTCGFQ